MKSQAEALGDSLGEEARPEVLHARRLVRHWKPYVCVTRFKYKLALLRSSYADSLFRRLKTEAIRILSDPAYVIPRTHRIY